MVMTDARCDLLHVHDRMPVILRPDQYAEWMAAPLDEAIRLCAPCPEPLAVDHTMERWAGARKPS